MLLMNTQAHKQGGQEREYISLKKSDENFQHVHCQCKGNGNGGDKISENKNDAEQRQYYDMTRQHIGKETNAQGKWFGQQTQEIPAGS